MLSLNCIFDNIKNSRFKKEQGATALLSSLGIRTPLSKIPLVGPYT